MNGFLERRFRGFRVVNLLCGALLLAIVFGVYMTKTFGGDQKSQIAAADRQIAEEQGRIKLLRAEVAYLARPGRLEALAETHLGMGPVAAARRIGLDDLPRLAPAPVPALQAAPGPPAAQP